MRFEIRVFPDHLDIVHVAATASEFLQDMFEHLTQADYPLQSRAHINGSVYVSTWTFPHTNWHNALAAAVAGLRHHGVDWVVVDGTTAKPVSQPGDG